MEKNFTNSEITKPIPNKNMYDIANKHIKNRDAILTAFFKNKRCDYIKIN